MTAPHATNSEEAHLGATEKIGYGAGDAASNLFFHTFNIFLLSYYVEVFGLSAAAVGTMFFVTKVFDAVTDPIMGIVADRTRSRWGRFRPYLLFGAVPFGLIGFSMFASPDLSGNGKLVYAYVTYSAMMLAYTALNVPYSALLGAISPNSQERTSASGYRFVMAFMAQVVISAFVFPLKNLLGGGDEALGYKLTMGIFAVLSTALWLFTFSTTRERVEPARGQETDLKGDMKFLLKNGPWVAVVFCGLFTLMNVAVRGGATIFYMKHYAQIGDEAVFWIFDRISIFFISGTLAMVVGATTASWLSKHFPKKYLMVVLTGLHGLILGGFFFIPPGAFWTMLAVNFIATLTIAPTPAIVWSMFADVADYGEWKFGRRTTGLIFSGVIFSHKTGLAIGAGLAGWILGWFGFVAGAVQTEQAIFGIRFMFSIVPGLLLILAAVSILFYKITPALTKQIETELTARRQEAT